MCVRQQGRQTGVTLIELILFIVIVSVAIAGILTVMSTVVKSSSDPVLRKQAVAMADAVLEEVLARAYSDPDGTSGETTRPTMDDVSDYAYFDGSATAKKILGSQMLGGTTSPLPDSFWAKVDIATVTVSAQTVKKITVTVINPQGESYVLSGYRGNY